MKQTTLIATATALAVASVLNVNTAMAEPNGVTQEELDTLKVQLIEAKTAVENAEKVAEDIVQAAKADAERILLEANIEAGKNGVVEPLAIKNAAVAVEISAGTIQEIATAIMPEGWRILVDVKDPKIKDRRFQYVSTKAREHALFDLLNPIGMSHQYFFELLDENGDSSPLLVISLR